MMVPNIQDSQKLVAGRAGELTLRANSLTFDLLEKLFGKNGPYRNVLQKFGLKINDTSETYLVLKDTVVYTDLTSEREVLWKNYPIILLSENGQVVQKFSKSRLTFFTLYNYLAKIVKDSLFITQIDAYTRNCHAIYKRVSQKTSEIYLKKYLTPQEFLTIYEEIIYVSYVYELVDLYNTQKFNTKERKQYIEENDYMLKNDTSYIELIAKLPNGFYLDDYTHLEKIIANIDKPLFIPDSIPGFSKPAAVKTTIDAEIELQCLKNNLRLKTNVLMYILNLTLLNARSQKNIATIGDKKLEELIQNF